VVTGAIAQDGAAHAIGNARLDLLEAGILASDPLAGSEPHPLAALLDCRNQIRQERRIILSIAVERRHDGTRAQRGPRCAPPPTDLTMLHAGPGADFPAAS